MKTVLYINGTLAVWICFQRKVVVNVHVESMAILQSDYQPCTWLGNKHHLVHLILDTEQASIDAYPLQRSGSIFNYLSNKRALRSTLIKQYPDAVVRVPKKSTGLDAIFVQQFDFLGITREWLAYVERSRLVFCSIATGSELLADLFAGRNDNYVVISNALGYHKHTFCRSGHALFTRTFEENSAHALASGLDETLSHLRSNELIDEPVKIYSIGFSEEILSTVAKLDWVNDTERFEDDESTDSSLNHQCDDDMEQYNSVIQLAKYAMSNSELRLSGPGRYCTVACSKYAQQVNQQRKQIQLVALAVITFVSVGVSGSKELKSRKITHSQSLSKASLVSEIDQLHSQVLDVSPVGIVLSQALLDAVAIKSGVGVSPAILLVIVAEAFTEHRELILQELQWVSVEHGRSGADDQQKRRDVKHATFRSVMPKNDEERSRLMVNIEGRTTAGTSLRDQQSAVRELAESLNAQQSVSNLTMLETPLSQLTGQQSMGNTIEGQSVFRIQFYLDQMSSGSA